jgi:argonaute-like protein implicated in RNA metabolism and viral defense
MQNSTILKNNIISAWSDYLSLSIENIVTLSKCIDSSEEYILNEYEDYFVEITKRMELTISYMESLMKLGFANENLTLFAKYIEIHTEELQLFNRLIVSLILNSNENHDQKESNIE